MKYEIVNPAVGEPDAGPVVRLGWTRDIDDRPTVAVFDEDGGVASYVISFNPDGTFERWDHVDPASGLNLDADGVIFEDIEVG